MLLDRRRMLQLTASGLFVPSSALAGSTPERKFLFVFADGGWDICKVFAPLFDTDGVDMDADAEIASDANHNWVSAATRPSVDTFFTNWGSQLSLLHGMEVRSITHERCTRIVFTGSGDGGRDDWGTVLAAHSTSPTLLLPYLVLDGKAFTSRYSSMVVRTGEDDQLPELLDGRILQRSDLPVQGLTSDAQAQIEAYLEARLDGWQASRGESRADFAARYQEVLEQAAVLRELESLSLETTSTGCSRDLAADAAVAFTCFEQGLARSALIRSQGFCEESWDTHERNDMQDVHFEELFGWLDELMTDLHSRTGASGAPLSEEVTVVVLSEMARHPRFNGADGRDHWTYTSCMLLGAGVRGGMSVGGYGESMLGKGVDLASGELDDDGTMLTPGHLGATLLALGDVDPGDYVAEDPITGLLA